MLKISIPKPCHEDWNAMKPDGQGRHCLSCAKTVVDFTNMNDDEVKFFFLNKKEDHVCGRFNNRQITNNRIELPVELLGLSMPLWKRFLAACLIVFSTTLFSCDTSIKPDISVQSERTMGVPVSSGNRTVIPGSDSPHIIGDSAFTVKSKVNLTSIDTTVVNKNNVCNTTKGMVSTRVVPEMTKGEIQLVQPDDTVKKQAMTTQDVIRKKLVLTGHVVIVNAGQLNELKAAVKKDSSDCNNAAYQ
ncbi:MAG: hypothetical protein ABJA78_11165 [Ferruginibacter sp.]